MAPIADKSNSEVSDQARCMNGQYVGLVDNSSVQCDLSSKNSNNLRKLDNGSCKDKIESKNAKNTPSILEIKRAIPKSCFESDLSTSIFYVIFDVTIICILYCSMLLIELQPYILLKTILIPTYWFIQGTFMWSLFVLGHDCGHGSFSKYTLINDIIGTMLHSMILVPYYPWKISHRHHHKNTCNIDKEEIFYPIRKKDTDDITIFKPLFGFGISWFAYLVKGYAPRNVCHINPFDAMFVGHIFGCVCSIGSCTFMIYLLALYGYNYGIITVITHYCIPCFIFASWLVVVTFLHHAEEGVHFFADSEWNFVNGQISSVDRDYGWAHKITHNIGTHQIHHLFSKIPHYKLEEATTYFRSEYPHLVKECNKPILERFYVMFNHFCRQRHIRDNLLVFRYGAE